MHIHMYCIYLHDCIHVHLHTYVLTVTFTWAYLQLLYMHVYTCALYVMHMYMPCTVDLPQPIKQDLLQKFFLLPECVCMFTPNLRGNIPRLSLFFLPPPPYIFQQQ